MPARGENRNMSVWSDWAHECSHVRWLEVALHAAGGRMPSMQCPQGAWACNPPAGIVLCRRMLLRCGCNQLCATSGNKALRCAVYQGDCTQRLGSIASSGGAWCVDA